MRIISGIYKGQSLPKISIKGTRPTQARVRKSMLQILEPFNGKKVLDLFAGSGVLGIEAISRGAISLVSVENDRKMFIKLEDLVTDELKLKELMSFIGLNYKSKSFNQLQRPHNVNIPKNFSLTKNQYIQFNDLCKETMIRFEYDLSKEYKVEYDQSNPIKY